MAMSIFSLPAGDKTVNPRLFFCMFSHCLDLFHVLTAQAYLNFRMFPALTIVFMLIFAFSFKHFFFFPFQKGGMRWG